MEARTERRALDVPRMPLDVLVRLTHEDFEEPFDADGVDVSAGGLALRADYLPEIGDRLRCRFDCPPDGAAIEVDGEVVWAHDAGERSGEFGLRFTELDQAAERALTRLLAEVGEVRSERPTARLHLEAVATPIDAEIVSRTSRAITVEQELPFLRLGMGVVVEGAGPAHGRLSAVGLRVENGVPRLVLSVRESEADEPGVEDTDDAVHSEAGAADWDDAGAEAGWEADAPVESDATLQDYELPASRLAPEPRVAPPVEEPPAPPVEEPRAAHSFELAEEERPILDRIGLARLSPVLLRAKDTLGGVIAKLRPTATAVWAKLALLGGALLAKAGPGAARFIARLRALGAVTASRLAPTKKTKRRTTAAPTRAAAPAPRLRRQREEASPGRDKPELAPRKTRRVVALSALAFVLGAAVVFAFTREDAPAAAAEPTTPAPAPVSVAAPAAPAPEPEPVVEEVAQEPEVPAASAPAPIPPPAAMPAPQTEAGRLGEPTFPSMREAGSRQSFGAAEVPNGRTTTLRMSQPVAGLRGERQPDGFTVTIPGALSLDRAGPIAASNPSVDQAMIINRGDHAVLTVRFVAGRNPPYRVVGRGQAIEVTIGR